MAVWLIGGDQESEVRAKDMIGEFVNQIMDGEITSRQDIDRMIEYRIMEIDSMISRQLSEVMHNPEFQKLEASWRGLYYLVQHSKTGAVTENPCS